MRSSGGIRLPFEMDVARVAFASLAAWVLALPFVAGQWWNGGPAAATLVSALLVGWCAWAFQRRSNRLRTESFTDPLTGLANRRAFEWRMSSEMLARHRHKKPLALLVLDLDLLKLINEKHGHSGGDRALRAVADSIRIVSRGDDLPARLGGDEFAVLAPRTSAEEAATLARRVQDALRAMPADDAGGTTISASAGISSTEMVTCQDAPGLMAMADAALFEAKHRGRDQLEIGLSSTLARARWEDAHRAE